MNMGDLCDLVVSFNESNESSINCSLVLDHSSKLQFVSCNNSSLSEFSDSYCTLSVPIYYSDEIDEETSFFEVENTRYHYYLYGLFD